jgi:hypothetical protein
VFLSHKLLRWVSPLVAALLLGVALVTWSHPVSKVVLAGTAILIATAFARFVLKNKIADAAFYFVLGQVALVIGLFKGLAGMQSVMWAKVDR